MILDKFFVHLRRGKPGDYLASKVLDFYGRLAIGGPRPDEIPGPDESVKKFLADNYFKIPVDRTPEKRNLNHEISALWVENLRQEEHPQVARAVVIFYTLICTALFGLTIVLGKSAAEFREWRAERIQTKAAEEAKAYAAKRDGVMKSLAEEVATYSVQQCLDEATKLRVRDTTEQRDRYSEIQKGCADKRQELIDLGKNWTVQQCANFAIEGNRVGKSKPGASQTFADEWVFQIGCARNHDYAELQHLINAGN